MWGFCVQDGRAPSEDRSRSRCFHFDRPRSATPGAGDGGNKFDLWNWNPEYFARLKAFVAQTVKCGIVVEVVLFCFFYDDFVWNISPLKAGNNVQGASAKAPYDGVYPKDPESTALQEFDLPAGDYRSEWVNPKTGKVEKVETPKHDGGNKTLLSPAYTEDIALQILSQ